MSQLNLPAVKSVAFLPQVKTSPDDDIEVDSTSGRSIGDSESESSADELLFPGLNPVVFVKLRQTTPPRIWCLRMAASPWFERASMLVILINCVTLGLYEPCDPSSNLHCETQRCQILKNIDDFVFAFFAAEMLVKMIAMGVWGKLGYLGEAWNRLDFFIVLCGMLEYTLPVGEVMNFTAIRTVRVLRPLRAINRVPSMRILVMLLLDTLPMLGNVLMLCSFVFFVFGVIAVQLWAGTLRQRCFLDNETFVLGNGSSMLRLRPYYDEDMHGDVPVCSIPVIDNGMFSCGDRNILHRTAVDNLTCTLNVTSFVDGYDVNHIYVDGDGGQDCVDWNQYYNKCEAGGENPSQGAINFDNIMYAWVAIFQVISLEGWVDIMYYVMDGYSFYSFIYFIFLIVIGSFFMINLCLVVIATQFSVTKQREQRLMEEQRLRFKSNDSTLASYSPPGNCYEEMFKYISHLYRKSRRRCRRRWMKYKKKREEQHQEQEKMKRSEVKKSQSIHLHHHHHYHHHHYHITEPSTLSRSEGVMKVDLNLDLNDPAPQTLPSTPLMITDGKKESDASVQLKNSFRLAVPSLSPASSILSVPSVPNSLSSSCLSNSTIAKRRLSDEVIMGSVGAVYFRSGSVDECKERQPIKSGSDDSSQYVTSDLKCTCPVYDVTNGDYFPPPGECSDSESSSNANESCWRSRVNFLKDKADRVCDFKSRISEQMKRIVESKHFNRGIMVAILVNTLSMGIEHHNQSEQLTRVLEISNIVFTTLFALEMVSKLIAFGFIDYIRNFYNLFDAVIVIISVWEIAAGTENGPGGLSVLRTFRLLRVLKLIRFLPALRRQLVVLMKTMDNVATFMMLLTLFIFIFSILGMHLFGCKFCSLNVFGDTECDRKNFDTLLWAFVTVFQILTQEDWNTVLYNGMDATTPFAAIYFITLMTIGNYVLFNLLVAILVEGFQAECNSETQEALERLSNQSSDEEDVHPHHVLAEEYTSRVARSLGIRSPSGSIERLHGAEEARRSDSETTSEEETDDETSRNERRSPEIRVNRASPAPGRSSPRGVPIITRTCATPTPCGSPSSQHKSLVHSFSEHDSESDSGASRLSDHQRLSPVASKNDNSSPRRGVHSRKSSTESCLSLGTLSRTGSWKMRMSKKALPLDEQSLVSWKDDSDDEDIAIPSVTSSFNQQLDKEENKMSALSFSTPPTLSSSSNRRYSEITYDMVGCGCVASLCSGCRRPAPQCMYERLNWSLYLLPPDNPFRRVISKVVYNRWFDNFILLFIFGNCVTIAMERPSIKPDSVERQVIDIFNYVFTVVFTVEMILKVIASGFYIGDKPYFKSGWNVLDFFLVVTSLIDVFMTLISSNNSKLLGMLRVFRLLRALRPLRVISRAPGLKLVVQTLLSSLKPIGNIVLICCAFFVIFGILGVQLFKGKFYYCDGEDVRHVVTRADCTPEVGQWVNRRYNFDDLGQALMSLFVLASKDGWVEIMYSGIDAVGVDMQPVKNNCVWLIIYFISFLLIVGFFVINMFVGVVVENFHRCREEHELQEIARKAELRRKKEERLLRKRTMRQLRGTKRNQTLRRRTMVRARSHARSVRGAVAEIYQNVLASCGPNPKHEENYYERYGRVRLALHQFCMNKYFELGVSAVIGINIVTMATEHYNQPKALDLALKYANYVFTSVFVLEAIIKLIALGVCRYFRDKWNVLDMIIVLLSIAGILIEDVWTQTTFMNPTIIRVMRVLRIARVLKLLKISKGIRSLLETMARALPQVGNLGMLFLLLFFIFAALGVELFGTLVCDKEHTCEGLNRHASFKNFGIALLTLFRISTGDNWNGIMKDTLRNTDCSSAPDCTRNCCVSSIISPLYFVVFVMMAQFVLVNVVIAVLMKQLEESQADSSVGDDEENDLEDEEDDSDEDQSDAEMKAFLVEEHNVIEIKDEKPVEDDMLAVDVTDDVSSVDRIPTHGEENNDKHVISSTDASELITSQPNEDFVKECEKEKVSEESSETSLSDDGDRKAMDTAAQIHSSPSAQSTLLILPSTDASNNSVHNLGSKSAEVSPNRSPIPGALRKSFLKGNCLNLPGIDPDLSSRSTTDLLTSTSKNTFAHRPLAASRSAPARTSEDKLDRLNLTPDELNKPFDDNRSKLRRRLSDNSPRSRPNCNHVHHHHYILPPRQISLSTNNLTSSDNSTPSPNHSSPQSPACHDNDLDLIKSKVT
ncbi:unnamed protein product [Clavelina lepadiformis]|uniref:Ion transport domain-containing protein n=1 Tax=Clavelina lepadiformis TaxID=159417 RepID=A0ABP0G7N6_CLALP